MKRIVIMKRSANMKLFAAKKIIATKLPQLNVIRRLIKTSSPGSVTMEYVIVSSFALLVSISAVTWLGTVVKSRVAKMAAKMGIEATEFDLDLDLNP
jgi:hypothetical protein